MSDFKITEHRNGDIVILDTEGYINNVGGEKIAEVCYKYIEEGLRKFLLNLEKSTVVNSIGVSIIIEIIEKLEESGDGRIGFYNLAPIVAKTFNIMGLTQYAKIYDSQAEAIDDMIK